VVVVAGGLVVVVGAVVAVVGAAFVVGVVVVDGNEVVVVGLFGRADGVPPLEQAARRTAPRLTPPRVSTAPLEIRRTERP